MFIKIKYVLLVAVFLGLSACGGDSNKFTSVYDVVQDSSNLTTLDTALQAAGLDETLDQKDQEYTLFAPTDAAFTALGADVVAALLADTDALADVLLYHVVSGNFPASSLLPLVGDTVMMANGDSVAPGLENEVLYVNYALAIDTNKTADNGVVHIIDAVLMPPALEENPTANIVETAVADGRFETLIAALQAAGLDAPLADESATYTVFAPTDDAFAMLPTGTITALLADTQALSAVLSQHVVNGAAVDSVTALSLDGTMVETLGGAMIDIDVDFSAGMLSVGGANVVISDIATSNGIIHVIDAVIVGDLDVPQPSIIDVAEEVGGFSTLLAALEATGLDVVLDDLDNTYTVFAPTDDAFAALGTETIAALLDDPDTLSNILLYHVIGGSTVLAETAVGIAGGDMSKVMMANDDYAGLSLDGDTLLINLSEVGPADVMASNGVIHVIDKVMLPPVEMGTPTDNIIETALAAGNFTTLAQALTAADLIDTLSDEDATFTVFAPTDAAFALIPDADLQALLADVPALTQVLLQHVISGSAVDSVTALTLNGQNVDTAATDAQLTLEISDGSLWVEGSAVSTFDIYTSNGVIHVIDAVILSTD